MEHRNATAAVIGAGDYIGAAIARRFAAEGYRVRRAPQRRETRAAGRGDRGGGRTDRREDAGRAQGERRRRLHAGRRRGGAAGSLRLQHRRQRQFPAAGDHRAGIPQGLGTGLLRRLPVRPRGGAR